MCRWLLKRAQGILILHHRGQSEEGEVYVSNLPDDLKRDQLIALTTFPLLSGLLSSEASLELDLTWGMFAVYSTARHMCSSLENIG